MIDESEGLILAILLRIDGNVLTLIAEIGELQRRFSRLERVVAGLHAELVGMVS